jgi:hypothetical protein
MKDIPHISEVLLYLTESGLQPELVGGEAPMIRINLDVWKAKREVRRP